MLDDDLENVDDLAADLQAGLDGSGWTARAKDDPAEAGADSEPDDEANEEGDDLRADLKTELAAATVEQAGEQDDAAAAHEWSKELRRLADDALRRGGLDPNERHAQGLSRREVARRLFNAERQLRENPTAALATLAGQYGSRLDDGGRLAAAQQVLAALGVDSPERLDQAAQARLQHYEAQQQAMRTATEAAAKRATERVEAFAKEAPHFAAVRGVMSALMQSGEAATIEAAYEQATRLRGLAKDPQTVAAEAAQARRDHAAKAARARTRKTASSVSGDAPSDQPLRDDLRDALYDQMSGRAH